MNSRNYVWKQTGIVLLGEAVLSGLMVGVYALIGRFHVSVVLGAAVGAALATLNFCLMALGTSFAADRAEQENVKGGQALIQMSYIGSMAVLFVVLALCAKSGFFDLTDLK